MYLNIWSFSTSLSSSGTIATLVPDSVLLSFISRLSLLVSNLIMCLLTAPTHPALVLVSVYTNLYIPLSKLSVDILTPLEQELKGLQTFRQPTQVCCYCPCSPSPNWWLYRRSWRRQGPHALSVWMWCRWAGLLLVVISSTLTAWDSALPGIIPVLAVGLSYYSYISLIG